ncbi:MAG TPA: hypothetical protein H9970_07925, partial [Candidatus Merdibacter merdipullorum]|nr:hypothetical protein [Candidatus Merdibacter merdipullorum]
MHRISKKKAPIFGCLIFIPCIGDLPKCRWIADTFCGTPVILHLRQYWPSPSMYLDNRPFSLLGGQKKHMKQKSSSCVFS